MNYNHISKRSLNIWQCWIAVTRSRCHLHFRLEGGSIESHTGFSRKASHTASARIAQDLSHGFMPHRILEIGASEGFDSLAFAAKFDCVEVHSVESDSEAVEVARVMSDGFALTYKPAAGFEKKLLYPDNHFDLFVCHTAIEYVDNVAQVV